MLGGTSCSVGVMVDKHYLSLNFQSEQSQQNEQKYVLLLNMFIYHLHSIKKHIHTHSMIQDSVHSLL